MSGAYPVVYDWNRKILPKSQQYQVRRSMVKDRLASLLPDLLVREGIDLWVIPAQECNNDPVWEALTGNSLARRTSILLIGMRQGQLWTGCLSRYEIGVSGHYEMLWSAESGEDQWACLGRVLRELDPGTIGLNFSEHFSFGDGISHSLYRKTLEAMGDALAQRVVSAERLALGFMEQRIEFCVVSV